MRGCMPPDSADCAQAQGPVAILLVDGAVVAIGLRLKVAGAETLDG